MEMDFANSYLESFLDSRLLDELFLNSRLELAFLECLDRICPASTDFEDILDEFGLVQSVQLPTQKSGNTLALVIGTQKFEIFLVSDSTSDHNWLNFDCLKHLLENRERSVVKFRNWKNVNLVDFNEDCFYHLWSIE